MIIFSEKQHMLFKKSIYGFIAMAFALLLAETGMRLSGYKPYDFRSRKELMELFKEKNKQQILFVPDSLTGYKLSKGSFIFPLPEGSFFKAYHDGHGHRNNGIVQNNKIQMHVYGCSIAYGICVEDDETLTAQLNKRDTTHQWINYGVPAFSMVQYYIEFKKNVIGGG